MKKEAHTLDGAEELLVEAHDLAGSTLPSTHPALDRDPVINSLAPHIQELLNSGFRIEPPGRQKPSDSGLINDRGY